MHSIANSSQDSVVMEIVQEEETMENVQAEKEQTITAAIVLAQHARHREELPFVRKVNVP